MSRASGGAGIGDSFSGSHLGGATAGMAQPLTDKVFIVDSLADCLRGAEMTEALVSVSNGGEHSEELLNEAIEEQLFYKELPSHLQDVLKDNLKVEVHQFADPGKRHLIYSQGSPLAQRPGIFMILHGNVNLHRRTEDDNQQGHVGDRRSSGGVSFEHQEDAVESGENASDDLPIVPLGGGGGNNNDRGGVVDDNESSSSRSRRRSSSINHLANATGRKNSDNSSKGGMVQGAGVGIGSPEKGAGANKGVAVHSPERAGGKEITGRKRYACRMESLEF